MALGMQKSVSQPVSGNLGFSTDKGCPNEQFQQRQHKRPGGQIGVRGQWLPSSKGTSRWGGAQKIDRDKEEEVVEDK